MSEKAKRSAAAVTNGASGKAGAGAGGGQASKFSTLLFKFLSDLDEIRKDGYGVQEYDKLCQELQKKKQEANDQAQEMEAVRKQCDDKVKEMQDQIAGLKSDNDTLTRQYETRFKTWDEDMKRRSVESAELTHLKEELDKRKAAAESANHDKRQLRNELAKHNRQAEQYQKEVSELRDECEKRELQLKVKEQELKKTDKELKGCRETLTQLNNEIGIQAFDQTRVERKFEELAAKFHNLVRDYFDRDISDSRQLTIGSTAASSRIPQAVSNSPAARAMRRASAEAVIALQLSTHIFVDFYPVDREADMKLSGLVRALDWLNDEHPLEATIIRCQLARVCNDSPIADEIPKQATDVVCGQLGPWLAADDGTRVQKFAAELEDLFSAAMGLWQKLQCTRTRVTAVASLDERVWFIDDDSWPEYGSTPAEEEPNMGGPLAVLFPQIRAGKDTSESSSSGGSSSLLFHGFALFPEQAHVKAAKEECKSQRASRRTSTFQRRRTSDGGSQGEPQRPHRRLSSASRDGAQQRSLLGAQAASRFGAG
ncbi:hypothetical protein B0T19DRAFT_186107 [Cercophora scortea]|uniref:Uncharacterized protein n=1 Tax=Cercophora scortea TaxID=314031 RepID=A0AAE0INK7_9PEZI|nr:hypothetical protein B0T19DRAFT_186107 [Cercophora scortea]